MTAELPMEFDEFRLVRRLGAGAMGEVYLAHDLLLDRAVAVKLIAPSRVSPLAAERFLVEARAAARVTHPNVAAVYRVGEIARRPYIISEFVRGIGLDRLPKPVEPARLLPLALGLARGLAAAHRRGVLHRDLKPANAIVADDGEVKLVDFGLAKLDGAAESVAVVAQPIAKAAAEPAQRLVAVNGGAGSTLVDEEARARKAARLDAPGFGTAAAGLTVEGALLGTPHYMAPECWRGEAATVRSDVYSLGALLYELACGRPPMAHVPLPELPEIVGTVDAVPLGQVAPAVPPRLAAIVDRCLMRDAVARFPSADALLDALEPLSAPRAVAPAGNPYRGLRPFEAEHRALFFGRAAETRDVVERLRREGFVLLAGDSGVGKSSLARAGVVPAIHEGALGGGRAFADVTLVPGRDPEAALLAALTPWTGSSSWPEGSDAAAGALSLSNRLVAALGSAQGIVLLIDQIEELVTLARPASARAAAEVLGALAAAGPAVRVLATVRGDFVTEIAALPGLGELVGRALHVVMPLAPAGVRDAITRPLEHTGARFESDTLVDELVASTAATDAGLPLLQFALAELWEARGGDAVLSRAALDAAGGVEAALARHADRVLASLLPSARAAARAVLLELVTPEGTRARRTAAELRLDATPATAAGRAALDALVRARLVVAREVDGAPVYEVAHEALLSRWETLRRWLEDAAGQRAVVQRLERAAIEWERLGRASEALWSARQLAEASLLERSSLAPRERAFLDAAARESRRRRARRVALALLLPVAVLAAVITQRTLSARALGNRVRTDVAAAAAATSEAQALMPTVEADVAAALARFAAADVAGGEERWARALAGRAALDRTLGRAAQSLETALMLDGSRRDVRARLAAVLFERARLADAAHRDAARDELVLRMGLYDDDGALRARWTTPARIAVDATPAAMVHLGRIVDEDGVRHTREERVLGTTPLTIELPPGGYVLAFSAPDRADARLPLVIERGERLPVAVSLPPARAVPTGFVYVPRGRFLFGSADEANRRGFYNTTPLHTETTEAFYIARHETTFGEWIAWLETLPPAERARRVPHSGKGTFHGAVQLVADGEHWRLKLTPNDVTYEARWGERLRYRGRDRRVSQDWRRMPVSGVDWEDTVAYAGWLSSTGRVPGARPCSELEWERAARGADDREFPHGDRLLPDDADFDATYGKTPEAFGPDAVGAHPASQSPFGVDDLAGNVWEWTRSVLEPDGVVVRGGSYYYAPNTDRSINREPTNRSLRDATLGVRLCADAR